MPSPVDDSDGPHNIFPTVPDGGGAHEGPSIIAEDELISEIVEKWKKDVDKDEAKDEIKNDAMEDANDDANDDGKDEAKDKQAKDEGGDVPIVKETKGNEPRNSSSAGAVQVASFGVQQVNPETVSKSCDDVQEEFTKEEDEIIKETVENSDSKPFTDWSSLAEKLPGRRMGIHIRQRWMVHLNPALNRSPFGLEDYNKLMESYEDVGSMKKGVQEDSVDGISNKPNKVDVASEKKNGNKGSSGESENQRDKDAIVDTSPLVDKKKGDKEDSKDGSNDKPNKVDEAPDKENGDKGPLGESENQSDKDTSVDVFILVDEEEGDEEVTKDESNNTPDKVEEASEKENTDIGSSREAENQSDSKSTPLSKKEVVGAKKCEGDEAMPLVKELGVDKGDKVDEAMPQAKEADAEKIGKEDEPMPLAKEVNAEKALKKEGPNTPLKEVDAEKTEKEDESTDKENDNKRSLWEPKNHNEATHAPSAKEAGEKIDMEDDLLDSSAKKRKEHLGGTMELPTKKRKEFVPRGSPKDPKARELSQEAVATQLENKPTQQKRGLPLNQHMMNRQMVTPHMMDPQMGNQMMNMHMANPSMMTPQMMNQVMNIQMANHSMINPQMMMNWGQFPPQLNPMQGMMPPFVPVAQANVAAQQMMMMMAQAQAQGQPNANFKPTHPAQAKVAAQQMMMMMGQAHGKAQGIPKTNSKPTHPAQANMDAQQMMKVFEKGKAQEKAQGIPKTNSKPTHPAQANMDAQQMMKVFEKGKAQGTSETNSKPTNHIQANMDAQQMMKVFGQGKARRTSETNSKPTDPAQANMDAQQMMKVFGQGKVQGTSKTSSEPTNPVQANVDAQQIMMKVFGQGKAQGTSKTSSEPMHPIPQGACLRVILTLPPPSVKLGILLDDNTTFGMPELKSVAKNSPIRSQIPVAFHRNSCVVSLSSQAIGHAEPKTARKCADLISKSQEGRIKPVKLEVVLVQSKMSTAPPLRRKPSPERKLSPEPIGGTYTPNHEGGSNAANEKNLFNQVSKTVLLDFFSDEKKPAIASFIRERNLPGNLRSAMERVLRSHKRLLELADLRDTAARRKEAYDIIETILPDTFTEKAETANSVQAALLELLVSYQDDPGKHKHALEIIQTLFPDITKEKRGIDKKLKMAVHAFFSDKNCTSLASFCEENKLGVEMRGIMRRFIDKDVRLSQLVDQRADENRRVEAYNIIEHSSGASNSAKAATPVYPKTAVMDPPTAAYSRPIVPDVHANAFFSPENIKKVAMKLDFEARPRIARDGSKEIEVHERKIPDEILILLTVDLYNRVMKGRVMSRRDKDNVSWGCAQILFYDHGYKKVTRMSNLEKTWESRLEQAYISGADMTPVNRNYAGSKSYTDKIENDYPGLLTKLHEYAEKSIGKDAPFVEKAMFMNEISMEDAADDPNMPILELNKTRLSAWVKQQKRSEGVEESAQAKLESKPEGDYLSFEKIEEKHPGLIDDLYNFAVEAMGPNASYHILATCMNEKSKEDVEQHPTLPLVMMSKATLPNWVKKRGL